MIILGRGYGRLFLVRYEKGNHRVMEILRALIEGEGLIVLGGLVFFCLEEGGLW